jgi:hypothetical protein
VGEWLLTLRAANGYSVLIHPKPDHEPAAHTILNFPVDDIEATVDALREAGVVFESEKGGGRRRDAARQVASPSPLARGRVPEPRRRRAHDARTGGRRR